jgi:hypothetical protein
VNDQLYAATGTTLRQNTLGITVFLNGGNFYARNFAIMAGEDFSLTANTSVTAFQGQNLGGGTTYPFGYFFTVGTTTRYSIFGIAGNRFGYLDKNNNVTYGDFAPGLLRSFVFSTGTVPEPMIWGMMIIGFSFVGYSMRGKPFRSQMACVTCKIVIGMTRRRCAQVVRMDRPFGRFADWRGSDF